MEKLFEQLSDIMVADLCAGKKYNQYKVTLPESSYQDFLFERGSQIYYAQAPSKIQLPEKTSGSIERFQFKGVLFDISIGDEIKVEGIDAPHHKTL